MNKGDYAKIDKINSIYINPVISLTTEDLLFLASLKSYIPYFLGSSTTGYIGDYLKRPEALKLLKPKNATSPAAVVNAVSDVLLRLHNLVTSLQTFDINFSYVLCKSELQSIKSGLEKLKLEKAFGTNVGKFLDKLVYVIEVLNAKYMIDYERSFLVDFAYSDNPKPSEFEVKKLKEEYESLIDDSELTLQNFIECRQKLLDSKNEFIYTENKKKFNPSYVTTVLNNVYNKDKQQNPELPLASAEMFQRYYDLLAIWREYDFTEFDTRYIDKTQTFYNMLFWEDENVESINLLLDQGKDRLHKFGPERVKNYIINGGIKMFGLLDDIYGSHLLGTGSEVVRMNIITHYLLFNDQYVEQTMKRLYQNIIQSDFVEKNYVGSGFHCSTPPQD
ncbi:MAG: hypothetical protein ACK5XN_12145, partial [Bacteroidota bacterium]